MKLSASLVGCCDKVCSWVCSSMLLFTDIGGRAINPAQLLLQGCKVLHNLELGVK